jgi:hypothetical protein
MDKVIEALFRQKWTLVEKPTRTYFSRTTDTHILELTDLDDMKLPEGVDEPCLMTIIHADDGKLFKQLQIPSLRWLVERRKSNESNSTQ